jgi:hypothetical protein
MALTAYILEGEQPVPLNLFNLAHADRLAAFLQAGQHILAQGRSPRQAAAL